MSRLAQWIERITTGVGVVGAWLIVPLIIATCYEVFSRYVLGRPTIWAFDVGYILMGSHFLLGGALALKEGGHIRIDIFYSRFSDRKRAVIDILGYILIALPVMFFISVELWDYALEAYIAQERSGASAWNPVIWPFKVVFFSGFMLVFLQVLAELLKLISGLYVNNLPSN